MSLGVVGAAPRHGRRWRKQMPTYYDMDGNERDRPGVDTQHCMDGALRQLTPTGTRHLHYLPVKGKPAWVVRSRQSPLCKTLRCRLVTIR